MKMYLDNPDQLQSNTHFEPNGMWNSNFHNIFFLWFYTLIIFFRRAFEVGHVSAIYTSICLGKPNSRTDIFHFAEHKSTSMVTHYSIHVRDINYLPAWPWHGQCSKPWPTFSRQTAAFATIAERYQMVYYWRIFY